MKSSLFILLSFSPILFSCELFKPLENCDRTARILTNKEVAFINSDVRDSTILIDENNVPFYITCVSKEHKQGVDGGHDKTCHPESYTLKYDELIANFSTNIGSFDNSSLEIQIRLNSVIGANTGSGYIRIITQTQPEEDFFSFATLPDTDSIATEQFPLSGFYKRDYKVHDTIFKDVYIFYIIKKYYGPVIVDTVYYQREQGFLKLVMGNKRFQFQRKF